MGDDLNVDACVAFLREQLAEAEKLAAAREDMAKANEGPYDRDEWRAVMDMHPTTRGKPISTKKALREDAERQRRIRDRYQREAALYRATIAFLAPDEAPCSCGGRRWVDDEGWQGDGRTTRRPGDGRIPCGFCNLGGWDVPDVDPTAPT